ncbi:heterokaryon incompatibility protein-domain-containing protein [Podospora fimiseda]|uniref:Heterokaryon incompatibility protein-domain-containing protein n=1 Tax=Podospora fimiseda TaxID=252190 RepID=A0AAN7BFP7_9PEZI|nr:heterokaryon incompatibility protein-domain-containing protein [Podospora fimiseda]
MPEFIDPGMPYHGVSPHLTPFLPYVEKADSSHLEPGFRMPGHRLSEPIDIKRLKAWLENCDTNHSCNVTKIPDGIGHAAWLVDVNRRCIVRFNHEPYVALSYVWGRASSMFLCKANLDSLQTPGALDDSLFPKTILDAMSLVASLDLTYLWTDRLCIVQDDVAEKQAQIQSMASIYASSYFTLIAAQSHDAAGPLTSRPLRSVSTSLSTRVANRLSSLFSKFKSEPDSVSLNPLTDTPWRGPRTNREVLNIHCVDLLRTIWFSRGWTFQEWLFSQRRIIFHSNTVNWECQTISLHERQPLEPSFAVNGPPKSLDETWANFHRYARLASLFSPRNFTFPEDVHDAFAGAARIFSQAFEGGLITGLPVQCFDQALMWQPYCPMKKRKEIDYTPANMDGQPVMPSWSWMSYQGNMQSESLASGWAYLYSEDAAITGGRWLIRPTVEWEHNEHEWYYRKVLGKREQRRPSVVPEGWEDKDEYFTTTRVPGQRFNYPIPLTNDPDRVSNQSRFLRCKSPRLAHVELDPEAYSSFAGECAVVSILDPESKEFVGCLRLNQSRQNITGKVATEKFTLMELSEGFVELSFDRSASDKEGMSSSGLDLSSHPLSDVFDEWSLPHWNVKAPQEDNNVYEFVNVMWIKPNLNDVVHRIAVGRVDKRYWKEKAVQEVSDENFIIG